MYVLGKGDQDAPPARGIEQRLYFGDKSLVTRRERLASFCSGCVAALIAHDLILHVYHDDRRMARIGHLRQGRQHLDAIDRFRFRSPSS